MNYHFQCVNASPYAAIVVMGAFICKEIIDECISRDLETGMFQLYSDALYAYSPNGLCWYKITINR
jgi:hypothetical protein